MSSQITWVDLSVVLVICIGGSFQRKRFFRLSWLMIANPVAGRPVTVSLTLLHGNKNQESQSRPMQYPIHPHYTRIYETATKESFKKQHKALKIIGDLGQWESARENISCFTLLAEEEWNESRMRLCCMLYVPMWWILSSFLASSTFYMCNTHCVYVACTCWFRRRIPQEGEDTTLRGRPDPNISPRRDAAPMLL